MEGVSQGDEFYTSYGGHIHPSHGPALWHGMILRLCYLHFAWQDLNNSFDALKIFVAGRDNKSISDPFPHMPF